jgi:putative membrane protein
MIDILIFSLIGICLGIASGMVPGLHVNNFIPILLSAAIFATDPYSLAALLISTAMSQLFVNFIPSIFLGAPDESTALSVLPGHRMLLDGRATEAIKLVILGGLGSLAASLALLFAFSQHFSIMYDLIRPYIHYVLMVIVAVMIFSEKKVRKIASASLIVLLSGVLGFIVLNSGMLPGNNSLFPLLSGIFGIGILLTSVSTGSSIPDQSGDSKILTSKSKIIKSIGLGSLAGLLVGFVPAVGVSQAASAFQYIGGLGEARTFLVSISGINVANEIFSLNALYFIGNPRSGVSVAMEKIFGEISFSDVLFFISVIVFSSGIACIATMRLAKTIPSLLVRVNYNFLSLGIVAFLLSMMFLFTGPLGVLVGVTAGGIGFLCNSLGVKRSTCMSVLILPTISFFMGLNPLIVSALSL